MTMVDMCSCLLFFQRGQNSPPQPTQILVDSLVLYLCVDINHRMKLTLVLSKRLVCVSLDMEVNSLITIYGKDIYFFFSQWAIKYRFKLPKRNKIHFYGIIFDVYDSIGSSVYGRILQQFNLPSFELSKNSFFKNFFYCLHFFLAWMYNTFFHKKGGQSSQNKRNYCGEHD